MPNEVLAPQTTVTWPMLFEVWAVLVADFQSRYNLDLEAAIRTETWRWFEHRAIGLLSDPQSRIFRRFAPQQDE